MRGCNYKMLKNKKEDNDSIRGKGSWEKAVNFLDYLLQTKTTSRKVGVATVLNKKNASSVKKFIEFFESKDIDDISFSLLDMTGNAKQNKEILQLTDNEIVSILKEISLISRRCKANIIMDTGSDSLNKYLTVYTGYKFHKVGVSNCGALFESAYCDMNGIYSPCRRYQGKGIDLKNDIDIIEKYYVFDDFLEKILQGNKSEKQCPLGRSCDRFTSVVNEMYACEKLPDLKIKNPICMYQKNNKNYIFYLNNNEYVQYSDIGWNIYKMIKKGMDTNDIINVIDCDKIDFINFIEHEINNGRLEVNRFEK